MEIAFQNLIGYVNQFKEPIFGVLSMICSFVLGKFLSKHTIKKKGGLSSMLETQKYCVSCNIKVDLPEWAFDLISKDGISTSEFVRILTIFSNSNAEITMTKCADKPSIPVTESDYNGN